MSNVFWTPGINRYPTIWDPSDSQYLVCTNSDFLNSTSSGIIGPSGEIRLCEVVVRRVSPANGILVRVGVAGTGLDIQKNFAGLYDHDGVLVARTEDQSVSWTELSVKKMPWAAQYEDVVVYPGRYYVALLATGLDVPRFSRGAASENCNIGYDSPPWRYSGIPGIATSLPSQIDLLSVQEQFHATFVGLWK